MALRLPLTLTTSFTQLNICERYLKCSGLLHKRYVSHLSVEVGRKQSSQSTTYNRNHVKYGLMCTMFTSFSLFLYSYKNKIKISSYVLPTVHAIEKTENSLRKRFNFIADVVENSGNAVVCIESRIMLRGGIQSVVPGGSGFIVKNDGLILTNAHVVINRPNSIVQVKLKDGRVFTGQIEDVDLIADLATVRIKANNLPVIKLGSSNDLRAGEWVVAIGSPLSLTDSVSAGVVSAPRRKGEDLGYDFKGMQYIQTDAPITFGNSGGPLVNLDGEVVGVNSMKVAAGISFAIPIEYAKDFLMKSEEKRKSDGESGERSGQKKSYIGVSMLTLTPELLHQLSHKNYQIPEFLVNRVLICQVIFNSPAFQSGLQPGDVIIEINEEPVHGVKSVYKALELGTSLKIKVMRNSVVLNVVVTPEQVF